MRRLILFSIIGIFLSGQFVYAQTSEKEYVYRIKVYYTGKKQILKAYLFQVKDSSILVSLTNPPQGGSILEIPSDRIDKLKVRKVGTVAKTAAVGALAGGIAGVLLSIDYAAESSFKRTEPMWMLISGGTLAIVGAVLGPFFGAESKKKFIIQGDQHLFKQIQADLKSLSTLK